jgi:hypothetical protein
MTLVMGALSLGVAARLMRRFGPQALLLAGLALIAAGLGRLSQLGDHSAYLPDVLVPFVLLGLGAGCAFLPLMTLAMADVPATDAGLASGIVNASLQISAAVGIAALGTIATDRAQQMVGDGSGLGRALTAGYTLAWELGAVSVLAGIAVALSVLTGAADDEAGMLSGLNTTGHEIGGSLGVAVLVTIATGAIGTGASTTNLASGLGDAFLVSGIIAAVAGVIAMFVLPSAASFVPKLRLAPRVAIH